MLFTIKVNETDSTLAKALAILSGFINVWDFIGLSNKSPTKYAAPTTLKNIVSAEPGQINSWLYFADTRKAVLGILQRAGQNGDPLVRSLSNEQLAALGTSVQILGPTFAASMGPSQLVSDYSWFKRVLFGYEDISVLGFLSDSQIAAIRPSVIAALGKGQLGTFCAQIGAREIAAMLPAQIASIPYFDWMKPSAFGGLTAEQISRVRTAGTVGGSWHYMTAAQIAQIRPTAFSGFSAAQFNSIFADQDGYQGINAAQLACVKSDVLATLSAENIAKLTQDRNRCAGVTSAQIQALNPSQIRAIANFQWLPPAAFAGLLPGLIEHVTIAGQRNASWAGVGANHISFLSPASFAMLWSDQIKTLTASAVAGVTREQVARMTDAAFAALSPEQLKRLSPDAFAGLRSSQLDLLSEFHIGVLSAQQLGALSENTFAGLTNNQMVAISDEAMRGVRAVHLYALSATTFAALTGNQVAAISDEAMSGVRAEHIRSLAPSKLAKFGLRLRLIRSDALAGLTQSHFDALGQDQAVFLRQSAYGILYARIAQLNNVEVAALFGAWRGDTTLMPSEIISAVAPAALTSWLTTLDARTAGGTGYAREWLTHLNDQQLSALPVETILALSTMNSVTAAGLMDAGTRGALSVAQFQTLLNSHADLLERLDRRVVAIMSAGALLSLTPAQIARLTAAQLSQILTNPKLSKIIFNAGQNGGWSTAQLQSLSLSALAGGSFTQETLAQVMDLGVFSGEQLLNGLLLNSDLAELLLTGRSDGWTEAERQQWRSLPGMDAYLTPSGLPGGARGRVHPELPGAAELRITRPQLNSMLAAIFYHGTANSVTQFELITRQRNASQIFQGALVDQDIFEAIIKSNGDGHRALYELMRRVPSTLNNEDLQQLTMRQIAHLASSEGGTTLLSAFAYQRYSRFLPSFDLFDPPTAEEIELQGLIFTRLLTTDHPQDLRLLRTFLFHRTVLNGYEISQDNFDYMVAHADREGMAKLFSECYELKDREFAISMSRNTLTQAQLDGLINSESIRTGIQDGGAYALLGNLFEVATDARRPNDAAHDIFADHLRLSSEQFGILVTAGLYNFVEDIFLRAHAALFIDVRLNATNFAHLIDAVFLPNNSTRILGSLLEFVPGIFLENRLTQAQFDLALAHPDGVGTFREAILPNAAWLVDNHLRLNQTQINALVVTHSGAELLRSLINCDFAMINDQNLRLNTEQFQRLLAADVDLSVATRLAAQAGTMLADVRLSAPLLTSLQQTEQGRALLMAIASHVPAMLNDLLLSQQQLDSLCNIGILPASNVLNSVQQPPVGEPRLLLTLPGLPDVIQLPPKEGAVSQRRVSAQDTESAIAQSVDAAAHAQLNQFISALASVPPQAGMVATKLDPSKTINPGNHLFIVSSSF